MTKVEILLTTGMKNKNLCEGYTKEITETTLTTTCIGISATNMYCKKHTALLNVFIYRSTYLGFTIYREFHVHLCTILFSNHFSM